MSLVGVDPEDYRKIPTSNLFNNIEAEKIWLANVYNNQTIKPKIRRGKVRAIKARIEALNDEIARRTERKPITDHAVIRYLERVLDTDIEALRSYLEKIVGAALPGDVYVPIEGCYYGVVKDGRMISVVERAEGFR